MRWGVIGGALAVVVALAVVAAARSGSGEQSGSGSGAVKTIVAGSENEIQRLSIESVDGEPINLPAKKPGVVFFFASWCGSCTAEATTLGRLAQQIGGGANILAVSIDPSDSVEGVEGFRSSVGDPSYPFAWDRTGLLTRTFNVTTLDTTLVYKGDGAVVYRGVEPDLATLRSSLHKAGVQ